MPLASTCGACSVEPMGWSHGVHWSEELIERELRVHIRRLGRMPSAEEIRAADGHGRLSSIISYGHGYKYWADRLGVAQKGTETHRAQAWERHEVDFFRGMGYDVTRHSTKHPYDLTINGHRVDVKMATRCDYGRVKGFVFAGLKRGADCDFFDLVCTDGCEVTCRFVIPAPMAPVHTITISPSNLSGIGRGKWHKFKDRTDLLHEDL